MNDEENMDGKPDVTDIKLHLVDLVDLIGFFDDVELGSPSKCKNVYDYIMASDYLYIELGNGKIYRFSLIESGSV